MRLRKRSLPLILLPLLLGSCYSDNSEAVREEAMEAIKDIPETSSRTSYQFEAHGTIGSVVDSFNYPSSWPDLPTGDGFGEQGVSFVFLLPVRINPDYFYSDDSSVVGICTYTQLKSSLAPASDPVHQMEFKKDGDNYLFYIRDVSRTLTFTHFYNPEGPEDTYMSAAGRFDIDALYDSEGFLIKESAVASAGSAAPIEIDVYCTYTYA
jgi:hypothetical protein